MEPEKKIKKTENLKEYYKQYYQEHKEKYFKPTKDVFCHICNKHIQSKNIGQHQKTQIHLKLYGIQYD